MNDYETYEKYKHLVAEAYESGATVGFVFGVMFGVCAYMFLEWVV